MANTNDGNLDIRARRGNVILVHLPHSYQKWVTWKTGPDGDCFWGNYFSNEGDAWENFYERSKEQESCSDEQMFEMRAAFGSGETVVNVLTGRKVKL